MKHYVQKKGQYLLLNRLQNPSFHLDIRETEYTNYHPLTNEISIIPIPKPVIAFVIVNQLSSTSHKLKEQTIERMSTLASCLVCLIQRHSF